MTNKTHITLFKGLNKKQKLHIIDKKCPYNEQLFPNGAYFALDNDTAEPYVWRTDNPGCHIGKLPTKTYNKMLNENLIISNDFHMNTNRSRKSKGKSIIIVPEGFHYLNNNTTWEYINEKEHHDKFYWLFHPCFRGNMKKYGY